MNKQDREPFRRKEFKRLVCIVGAEADCQSVEVADIDLEAKYSVGIYASSKDAAKELRQVADWLDGGIKTACPKCGTKLSCGSCKAKKAASKQTFTKEQRAEWGRRGGRGKKKVANETLGDRMP